MKSPSVPLLRVALAASCLAATTGCSDHDDAHEEKHAHDEHHDEHGKEEKSDDHDGHDKAPAHEADVVKVAPDMLRDLRITTAKAQSRAAGEGVTLLGALRVNDDAYAEVACAIPARIKSVAVALGATVKAGDALAEVESAEIGRARAELLNARARRELANSAADRKRPLVADQVVPARELQEAEAELRAADAALQAARSTLSSFGISSADIEKTSEAGGSVTLRAPIAGTVIERNAVRGARVDAEHTLFRIADEKQLWLVVHAFERDAVRLNVGSEARVHFPALPGKTFTGKVTNVGREVEPTSRTIPVRVAVANDAGELRSGMSANAWVPLGEATGSSIVAIPLTALQRLERDWVAFVPKGDPKDGVFWVKKLGRGRDLGNEVEILSGLAPGDDVVVDGAFLLKAEVEKAAGGGDEHGHGH